jgi:hypothetical protein
VGGVLPGSSTTGIGLIINAAERALRGIVLGRHARLFAGADRASERAAFMYTLIVTATFFADPAQFEADAPCRVAWRPCAASRIDGVPGNQIGDRAHRIQKSQVEAKLGEVDPEIRFKKNDELDCVQGVEPRARKQRVFVAERSKISMQAEP